jgi:hypothetical protein
VVGFGWVPVRREHIDHILGSHLVAHTVADGDVTAGPVGHPVGDDPNRRRNEPGSDHRPLIATILFAGP